MLKSSLDALMKTNAVLAKTVCESDDEADRLDQQIYKEVQRQLRAHPESSESLVPILEASHNLERIADHATNIAEDVIDLVEGEIIRHLA